MAAEYIRLTAAQNGLEFEVVESVPVHEDIKMGKPARDALIDVYCENIRRLPQLPGQLDSPKALRAGWARAVLS